MLYIFIKRRLILGFDLFGSLRPILRHISSLYRSRDIAGYHIQIKGRFSRRRRKQKKIYAQGYLPWNTLNISIDYGECICITKYGTMCIKIWIFNRKQSIHNAIKKRIILLTTKN